MLDKMEPQEIIRLPLTDATTPDECKQFRDLFNGVAAKIGGCYFEWDEDRKNGWFVGRVCGGDGIQRIKFLMAIAPFMDEMKKALKEMVEGK